MGLISDAKKGPASVMDVEPTKEEIENFKAQQAEDHQYLEDMEDQIDQAKGGARLNDSFHGTIAGIDPNFRLTDSEAHRAERSIDRARLVHDGTDGNPSWDEMLEEIRPFVSTHMACLEQLLKTENAAEQLYRLGMRQRIEKQWSGSSRAQEEKPRFPEQGRIDWNSVPGDVFIQVLEKIQAGGYEDETPRDPDEMIHPEDRRRMNEMNPEDFAESLEVLKQAGRFNRK